MRQFFNQVIRAYRTFGRLHDAALVVQAHNPEMTYQDARDLAHDIIQFNS